MITKELSMKLSTVLGWRPGVNLLLTFVALLAAVLAYYGARALLTERSALLEQDVARRYATRPVVVATRDLVRGDALSAPDLALRDVPSQFAPSGTLGAEAAPTLVGRRLLHALRRGDPVTPFDVEARGSGSLANRLPAGQRALTIAVDELNAAGGLLRAGDHVDLYYSRQQGGDSARLSLLFAAVPVLAAGHQLAEANASSGDAGAGGFATITLQLPPADAARVVLAQHTGQLTVVLRHPDDPSSGPTGVHDSRGLLLTTSAVPPARAAAIPQAQLQLILGGQGAALPAVTQLPVIDLAQR
jgi:pilus assembly protein CpaB